MAAARLGREALAATFAFTGGSGGLSGGTEPHQKAVGGSLDLPRRQQGGLGGAGLGMPSRTQVADLLTHEQELHVGEGTEPHPAFDADQVGRLIGSQAQMLFQEAKGVFNGKTPQIDAGEVSQRDIGRPAPEQPERIAKAGCPVFAQELDAEHHAYEQRQFA